MARTVGCIDLGQDCDYRIVANSDEDDLIVETTMAHAKKHHAELAADEVGMRQAVRSQIKNLFEQSHTDLDIDAISS